MSKNVTTLMRYWELMGKSTASSNHTYELLLKLVDVYILEMEDVLFHHNSAVMMPDNPQGKSAADGTEDDAADATGAAAKKAQETVAGVKALALVFKEIEFDPDKRIIIAGHTDTSGDFAYNYELSARRAKNVLYLLTGQSDSWARECYEKHKVEDYQQIMTYLVRTRKWPCDPKGIDNTWGDKTKAATDQFIATYNVEVAAKRKLPPLSPDLTSRVEMDTQKRWKEELWKAVYEIYSQDMAEALEIPRTDLGPLRASLEAQGFVSPSQKFVGCGESFPIDKALKDNYRSQVNRRVEILFFDKDELPEVKCPPDKNRAHTKKECPLWHEYHFLPLYVDPKDLESVVYHVSFQFFDRVKQKRVGVPEGLKIDAYKNGAQKLQTTTGFKNGVYFVKVQFPKPMKDPGLTRIHFEFTTANKWIYVKDGKSDPQIVTATPDAISKLPFTERIKYYDLPAKWSSQNYWTRYDGNYDTGERFEKVVKDLKKLKPFGSSVTSPKAPLVFSLDDIVLGGANRTQVITDASPAGASLPLGNDSRYALFYVDDAVTEQDIGGVKKNVEKLLKIHNPFTPDEPVFTRTPLATNLITDVPGNTRIVYFCNNFYDVYDKRSRETDPGFNAASGHIIGARLALLNDRDCHGSHAVVATQQDDRDKAYALTPSAIANRHIIGNYELHYFHNCSVLDKKPLGYLLIYWSCRFQLKALGGGVTESTAADITNHRQTGMTNAMARLNKDYMIERASGTHDILIRPFHYMEAKGDSGGGPHKCMVDVVGNYPTSGAWMNVAVAQFRTGDYQPDATYLGNPDADNNLKDTDGRTYQVLTNQHEMGHATGNPDEYLYAFVDITSPGPPKVERSWGGLPRYDQPFTAEGGPYSCDKLSRMNVNRTPRLKDFWKFVCWLHDASKGNDVTKPDGVLTPFIGGTQFKLTFKADGFTHAFTLPEANRNIFLPAHRFDNRQLSPPSDTAADLLLYRLGDSETARVITAGQIYKAILVVRPKIAVQFVNNPPATWTFAGERSWLQGVDGQIKSMLNAKFRLRCPKTNDFDNIYFIVVPHYCVYSDAGTNPQTAQPADSHIDLSVRFILGDTVTHLGGKAYRCDWGLSAAQLPANYTRIARQVFGYADANASFTVNEFPEILSWVNGLAFANDTFTMVAL